EIDRIGPVPVTTARAMLDDASVAVMLRDGDDITAVTSPKRLIPAKLRRALEARYATCGVKGLRQRPVPADRPCRRRRGPRTTRDGHPLAHLHPPPRVEDVRRLAGRRRARPLGPRASRRPRSLACSLTARTSSRLRRPDEPRASEDRAPGRGRPHVGL